MRRSRCGRPGALIGFMLMGFALVGSDVQAGSVRVRVKDLEGSAQWTRSLERARHLERSWRVHGVEVRPLVPNLEAFALRRGTAEELEALRILGRWYTAEVPSEHLEAWWIAVVSDPTVVGPVVEPLAEIQSSLPSDPRVADQSWFLEQIGAPAAWQVVRGSDGDVVVAVVDTGTDIGHPDLAANLWTNAGEIPGNGIDDDGNGFVDDVHGWSFTTNAGDPTGLPEQAFNRDHGTHVAGLISAVTDNGIGVAGVGFNLRLMSVNAADPERDRFVRYGYDGIVYAALMGADVINCSWRTVRSVPGGGPLVSPAFRDFENDVCAAATALGSLIVAAAGNDASSTLEPTPAFYPTVLSVTATRFRSDVVWSGSNTGPWVDLAAPGEFLLSTVSTLTSPQTPYSTRSGTSMSAAVVSAAAGLLKVRHPTWSPLQLKQRLVGTANSIVGADPVRGPGAGAGMVRMDRAVLGAEVPGLVIGPPLLLDADGDGVVEGGEEITLAFAVTSPFAFDGAVEIEFGTEDPHLRTLEEQIRLPRLPAGSTLEVRRGLKLYVRESVPSAHIARLDFTWRAGGASGRANHWVELLPLHGAVRTPTLRMSAAANGKLGYADPTRSRLASGVGLRIEGSRASSMVHGGLVVGTGPNRVSDAVQAARPASAFEDFRPEQLQSLEFERGDAASGLLEQVILRFNDNASANRLGIGVEQRLTAWADGSRGDFVLSHWRLRARVAPITGMHIGILTDWSAPDEEGQERIECDPSQRMQWVRPASGAGAPWAGAVMLEGPGDFTCDWLWAIAPQDLESRDGRPALYDVEDLDRKLADERLWELMVRPEPVASSGAGNVAAVFATGPVDLDMGGSTDFTVAFAVADDLDGLLAAFEDARSSWRSLREGRDGRAPGIVELLPNLPNPFASATAIRFAVPVAERVRIDVYDVRGRRVRTLLDSDVSAGFHRQTWDGRDDGGREVASGVYFVQLRSGTQTLSRRVVLARS